MNDLIARATEVTKRLEREGLNPEDYHVRGMVYDLGQGRSWRQALIFNRWIGNQGAGKAIG